MQINTCVCSLYHATHAQQVQCIGETMHDHNVYSMPSIIKYTKDTAQRTRDNKYA
jgi:hypothetical protein